MQMGIGIFHFIEVNLTLINENYESEYSIIEELVLLIIF